MASLAIVLKSEGKVLDKIWPCRNRCVAAFVDLDAATQKKRCVAVARFGVYRTEDLHQHVWGDRYDVGSVLCVDKKQIHRYLFSYLFVYYTFFTMKSKGVRYFSAGNRA